MWLFLLVSKKQGRRNTRADTQPNPKALFSPITLWLVFFLCFCGTAAVWPTPWLVPAAAAVWWCKCSTIPATVPNLFKHSTVLVNPPLVTLVCLYQLFILPKSSDLPVSLFCYIRTPVSIRHGLHGKDLAIYVALPVLPLIVTSCGLPLCYNPMLPALQNSLFSPLTSYFNFFFSWVSDVCWIQKHWTNTRLWTRSASYFIYDYTYIKTGLPHVIVMS